MWITSLSREDALEKEVATHSSILAWKILWIEEPGRLQSMGSQRADPTNTFTFTGGSDHKESTCNMGDLG